MSALGSPQRPLVLGMHVDHVEFDQAAEAIARWVTEAGNPAQPDGAVAGSSGGQRMICAANVHMVMEARDDAAFQQMVNSADLVVADGQPMVWALRLQGVPQQRRVRVSPNLIVRLLTEGERCGWRLGLYGGSDETLPVFLAVLARDYPRLAVPFAWAPPFRPLTSAEDDEVVARIREAGVQLLLVGLGCPKQERWMAAHRDRLPCVMMGVGAAFDLLGGRTKEAPRWTHGIGLEWAFRLAQEPRRLWRRHLKHDPRFLTLLAREAVRRRLRRGDPHTRSRGS